MAEKKAPVYSFHFDKTYSCRQTRFKLYRECTDCVSHTNQAHLSSPDLHNAVNAENKNKIFFLFITFLSTYKRNALCQSNLLNFLKTISLFSTKHIFRQMMDSLDIWQTYRFIVSYSIYN